MYSNSWSPEESIRKCQSGKEIQFSHILALWLGPVSNLWWYTMGLTPTLIKDGGENWSAWNCACRIVSALKYLHHKPKFQFYEHSGTPSRGGHLVVRGTWGGPWHTPGCQPQTPWCSHSPEPPHVEVCVCQRKCLFSQLQADSFQVVCKAATPPTSTQVLPFT